MTRQEFKLHEISPVHVLRNEGLSYSKIAKKQNMSRTTVRRLIQQHAADEGATLGVPS